MVTTAATLAGILVIAVLAVGPWIVDVLPARRRDDVPAAPTVLLAAWDAKTARSRVRRSSLVPAA